MENYRTRIMFIEPENYILLKTGSKLDRENRGRKPTGRYDTRHKAVKANVVRHPGAEWKTPRDGASVAIATDARRPTGSSSSTPLVPNTAVVTINTTTTTAGIYSSSECT